ncbi:MAG: CsiV family protein [Pseudomonadota bacterium]
MRPTALLILLLLLLTTLPAHAEEETRWYDVEVMLFVQNNQDYRHTEVWPLDYTLPRRDNARALQMPTPDQDEQDPTPFTLLPRDALRLSSDAARIERARDMELLLHFGWRQPGLPREEAVAVDIDSKTLAIADAPLQEDAQNAAEPSRLEGTLTLILSRYLHLRTDLLYREPLEEPAMQSGARSPGPSDEAAMGMPLSDEAAFSDDLFLQAEEQAHYQVYRMQQSRRMRSKELHYFDHPVFGLVVKVYPYELSEPEQADEAP